MRGIAGANEGLTFEELLERELEKTKVSSHTKLGANTVQGSLAEPLSRAKTAPSSKQFLRRGEGSARYGNLTMPSSRPMSSGAQQTDRMSRTIGSQPDSRRPATSQSPAMNTAARVQPPTTAEFDDEDPWTDTASVSSYGRWERAKEEEQYELDEFRRLEQAAIFLPSASSQSGSSVHAVSDVSDIEDDLDDTLKADQSVRASSRPARPTAFIAPDEETDADDRVTPTVGSRRSVTSSSATNTQLHRPRSGGYTTVTDVEFDDETPWDNIDVFRATRSKTQLSTMPPTPKRSRSRSASSRSASVSSRGMNLRRPSASSSRSETPTSDDEVDGEEAMTTEEALPPRSALVHKLFPGVKPPQAKSNPPRPSSGRPASRAAKRAVRTAPPTRPVQSTPLEEFAHDQDDAGISDEVKQKLAELDAELKEFQKRNAQLRSSEEEKRQLISQLKKDMSAFEKHKAEELDRITSEFQKKEKALARDRRVFETYRYSASDANSSTNTGSGMHSRTFPPNNSGTRSRSSERSCMQSEKKLQ